MKCVLSLLNSKSGNGKTTLGLNFCFLLANEFNLKTVFIDCGDGVFETEFVLKKDRPFTFSTDKTADEYFLNKEKFYLSWVDENNLTNALEYWLDKTDVAVFDTRETIKEEILNVSGEILIPTVLSPFNIKCTNFTINKIREMKYPLNAVNVLINKNNDGLLKDGDLREIFKDVKVSGVVPFESEIINSGGIIKNKKSAFYRDLFKTTENLINNFPEKNYKEAISKINRHPIHFYPHENDEKPAVVPDKEIKKPNKYAKVKKDIRKKLFDEMDIRNLEKDALTHPYKRMKIYDEIKEKIRNIFDKSDVVITDRDERERIIEDIYNEVTGLGAIEDFIKDDGVSEIMVNRHDQIYVEKNGKLIKSDVVYTDDEMLLRAIEKIVLPLGRRIDESTPYVDARLSDGSRVNAIIPPLALDGPVLTIRKFSKRKLTMDDLIKYGSINKEAADYLQRAVIERKNIIVSGGTGSGKTTLLNVLSSFIPEDERIITVEDSAELRLNQEHVIRLEARPPNIEGRGAVTIRDLVKNCLRMRPDRIIVGECRGGESLDMLQAMNTGHEGSMTTVHANSARDALSRIEVMVLMAGVELPLRAIREQIKSAVDIIVQQARLKDGTRKITAIAEVTGMEVDTILMHNVFEYDEKSGILKKTAF
ncbi:MAG: Flp pilus assembly complex ATPase component TadA [Candidatus Goldbacteria bacterium]|nr:Flp pilus assembly complex ATPase component TadA [Candidatus Goldiibacteriota bacterium]